MFASVCSFPTAIISQAGKAFIHTSNLLSEKGFERFKMQSHYTVGGFYFVSPDIVNTLAVRAGFSIIKKSTSSEYKTNKNMYYQRDYCLLIEKSG